VEEGEMGSAGVREMGSVGDEKIFPLASSFFLLPSSFFLLPSSFFLQKPSSFRSLLPSEDAHRL
jgi:hypothetical protein